VTQSSHWYRYRVGRPVHLPLSTRSVAPTMDWPLSAVK